MKLKLFSALICLSAAACGGHLDESTNIIDDDASAGDDGSTSGMDGGTHGDSGKLPDGGCTAPPCKPACDPGVTTSISGTAFAPNGSLPLYNVIAYVPSADLSPLTDGATCDRCGSAPSGKPVATALSDSHGKFKLVDVPAGDNIPLVLQVGKWRRKVVIPHVEACKDTALIDPELTRLPKKQSEGNMPHIAVTTGSCDPVACVLPKLGIDASEFGFAGDIATKRVIFYSGVGPTWGTMTPATNFWSDVNELKKFDVTMLSCECSENLQNKPAAAFMAMSDYLNAGGRILASDFMYTWFKNGPAPLPTTAQTWYGGAPFDGAGVFTVDATFPKGKAMTEWLQAVGGSTTLGQVPIPTAFSNLSRVTPGVAREWVSGATDKVFTVNTPIGSAPGAQCGRGVFLDAHTASGSVADVVDATFPLGCAAAFTPTEKAFAFFLMDLESCIQPDADAVTAPPLN